MVLSFCDSTSENSSDYLFGSNGLWMTIELPTQKSGKYKAVSGANLGSQGVMNLTQCDYVRSIKSAFVPIGIRD